MERARSSTILASLLGLGVGSAMGTALKAQAWAHSFDRKKGPGQHSPEERNALADLKLIKGRPTPRRFGGKRANHSFNMSRHERMLEQFNSPRAKAMHTLSRNQRKFLRSLLGRDLSQYRGTEDRLVELATYAKSPLDYQYVYQRPFPERLAASISEVLRGDGQ